MIHFALCTVQIKLGHTFVIACPAPLIRSFRRKASHQTHASIGTMSTQKSTLCLPCNPYFSVYKPTVYRLLTSTILFLSLFSRDIKGHLRPATCLHWNTVRNMLCSVLKRSCCVTMKTWVQIHAPIIPGEGGHSFPCVCNPKVWKSKAGGSLSLPGCESNNNNNNKS